MECPKCHAILNENENTCPNCGWKKEGDLSLNTSKSNIAPFSFDFIPQVSPAMEEKPIEKVEVPVSEITEYKLDSVVDDKGNPISLEMVDEEMQLRKQQEKSKVMEQVRLEEEKKEYEYDEYDLLKSYIGKNVDKITDEGFSFATFFFGAIHLAYRKCWKYFFLVILVLIVAIIPIIIFSLPSFILSIVDLIIIIILGCTFRKFYINDSLKKIRKIMVKNKGKSFTEVSELCSIKGGTSVPAVVLSIIACIIMIIGIGIVLIIFFFDSISSGILNEFKNIIGQSVNVANQAVEKQEDMNNYITAVENGYQTAIQGHPEINYAGAYTELSGTMVANIEKNLIIEIDGVSNTPNLSVSDDDYIVIDENGKVTEAQIKFDTYFATYCNGTISVNNTEGFQECKK